MKIDYDRQAELYEKTRDIEPLVYSTLSSLLTPVKGDVILDFGCGTGDYLKKFATEFEIEAYGIEPAANMRKIAQKKLTDGSILNGNHISLPFSKPMFNKIYSTDVIHHINDLPTLFSNLKNVAVPKAKFCICTESSQQLAQKYWIKYFPSVLEADMQRFHSIKEIIIQGEDAGWNHKEILTIEDEVLAPISQNFMERVEQKTLSVFHLISNEVYERGFLQMQSDYQSQILLHQHEGYTFILFERSV